jgi:prolyl oligopeptidase
LHQAIRNLYFDYEKIVFLAIIINTLTAKGDTLSYPDSKPGNTVDTLHDIKIPDPYRWLEDLNSEQTSAWVKAQNSLTDSYLDAIPGRKALENHLTKLWNVERIGVPSFEGGLLLLQQK